MNIMQIINALGDASRSGKPMDEVEHSKILKALQRLTHIRVTFYTTGLDVAGVLVPRRNFTFADYDHMINLLIRYAGFHYVRTFHGTEVYAIERHISAIYGEYAAEGNQFMMDHIIESGLGFGTVINWNDRA